MTEATVYIVEDAAGDVVGVKVCESAAVESARIHGLRVLRLVGVVESASVCDFTEGNDA